MQLDYCLKIMETVLNDLKCIGDPIGHQNTCVQTWKIENSRVELHCHVSQLSQLSIYMGEYLKTYMTILYRQSCSSSWCLSFRWWFLVFLYNYILQLQQNVLHCGFLVCCVIPWHLHYVPSSGIVCLDFFECICDTVTNCWPKLLPKHH